MAASSRCDVLVIGSDAASLAAAIDCARIGLSVTVWIPADVTFSSESRSFTHREGIVAALLDHYKIGYSIDKPIRGEESILGIPGNPFSARVTQSLGKAGRWRVYRDRITPILTIGAQSNLGTLVQKRMGEAALTQLVNPATQELYGLNAVQLDVSTVAPGLSAAMTRAGSLSGGVLEQYVADPRVCERLIVEGGDKAIIDSLLTTLEYFSATIVRPKDTSAKLEKFARKAGAFLLDFGDVDIPENVDKKRIFEVGISLINPGLDSALPASLQSALHARRLLLSNPENPPIGPTAIPS
jgi:oxygen-dependent protoporphyrinogen oxidase